MSKVRHALALDTASLPAMPVAATRVLALLRDPTSDAGEVEKALRLDPGITGNLLRLTNSAYFGFSGRIGSVRQAVVRLGWERVSQMVLALSVRGVMADPVVGYDLPPGELWRHALAVSVASEELLRELGVSAPEETFTAALLHDVGKLVVGRMIRDEMVEIEKKRDEGLSFEDAERAVLGIDHAEAGALVLANWSLPAPLVDAVRWHHDPDGSATPGAMVDVVHVADVLALMMGIGTGREGLGYQPSQAATRRLGVRVSDLETVASRTLQGLGELTRAFDQG